MRGYGNDFDRFRGIPPRRFQAAGYDTEFGGPPAYGGGQGPRGANPGMRGPRFVEQPMQHGGGGWHGGPRQAMPPQGGMWRGYDAGFRGPMEGGGPGYGRDFAPPRGGQGMRGPGVQPQGRGPDPRDYERMRHPHDCAAEQVHARDIMTRDPECVTADTLLSDAAVRMREQDIGILPVVHGEDDRRLRGVVTDRDIVIRALANGTDGNGTVGDCMTEGVETVALGACVHDVLDVMKRARVRRVPVVDDDQRLVGIIAQADLAVTYAGLDRQRETEVEEAIERISEPAGVNRRMARAAAMR
ncbi:MAG TPA: CBS domain-containing protein [Longimicrobiaceae bacterium]|nr:CBS domain-containing protein [Longimicrobiaceae bacterium]